jgi:hypothetical protein
MAEAYAARVPAGAGFLGILELSTDLMRRVRSALDDGRGRRFGRRAALGVLVVGLLFVPLGAWSRPPSADPQSVQGAGAPETHQPPRVSATEPRIGSQDVDPGFAEIRVTFDQEMDTRGHSWTGAGEAFPECGRPYWIDRRTCALPVTLEAGRFYRVGINSKSHTAFRSRHDIPTFPEVIFFTTKGADQPTLEKLRRPRVVGLTPESGAKGVAPGVSGIAVTFDMPMSGSYSWVGDGPNMPESSARPTWSDDKRTCTLRAELKPNWYYSFGLNSEYHIGFRSADGVPLKPVAWDFHTRE